MSANAWFSIVLGVICLGIGIFKGLFGMLDASKKEKQCTEKVTATISELKIKVIRKKAYNVPVYSYTVGDKEYHVKSTPELPNEHKIGQTEHILIDPAKPERMIPGKGGATNSAPIFYLWTLAGVVLLVYGLIVAL